MRRGLAGGSAAALVLVLVAACGGGAASPSGPASAQPSAGPTTAPATEAPSTSPEPSSAAAPLRLLAACEGVAIRIDPSTSADLIVRVPKLTKVRVVATVDGEAYTTGACGTSGSQWVKVDRVNGTSMRKLYDVPFGYAAAGFFE
jgi:hypothetical protein